MIRNIKKLNYNKSKQSIAYQFTHKDSKQELTAVLNLNEITDQDDKNTMLGFILVYGEAHKETLSFCQQLINNP